MGMERDLFLASIPVRNINYFTEWRQKKDEQHEVGMVLFLQTTCHLMCYPSTFSWAFRRRNNQRRVNYAPQKWSQKIEVFINTRGLKSLKCYPPCFRRWSSLSASWRLSLMEFCFSLPFFNRWREVCFFIPFFRWCLQIPSPPCK